MSSIFYHGIYETKKFTLPVKVEKKNDLSDSDVAERSMKMLMNDKDLLCKSIEFRSRKFEVGSVVILNRTDKLNMEAGLIKSILVKQKKVYLVLKRYTLERLSIGAFESGSPRNELEIVDIEILKDTYPLFKRGTDAKFIVVLHHHVSFSFD